MLNLDTTGINLFLFMLPCIHRHTWTTMGLRPRLMLSCLHLPTPATAPSHPSLAQRSTHAACPSCTTSSHKCLAPLAWSAAGARLSPQAILPGPTAQYQVPCCYTLRACLNSQQPGAISVRFSLAGSRSFSRQHTCARTTATCHSSLRMVTPCASCGTRKGQEHSALGILPVKEGPTPT